MIAQVAKLRVSCVRRRTGRVAVVIRKRHSLNLGKGKDLCPKAQERFDYFILTDRFDLGLKKNKNNPQSKTV